FEPSKDWKWIEASLQPKEGLVSDCATYSKRLRIDGARWDTGSDIPITIHQPWQKAARPNRNSWSGECEGIEIARKVEASLPQFTRSEPPGLLALKKPGVTLGVSIMDRGPFVMDLSNGRLWFESSALEEPVRDNDTGLEVKYVLDRAEER